MDWDGENVKISGIAVDFEGVGVELGSVATSGPAPAGHKARLIFVAAQQGPYIRERSCSR